MVITMRNNFRKIRKIVYLFVYFTTTSYTHPIADLRKE